MPIHIISSDWKRSFAFLCEEDWELPGQIQFLETWLARKDHGLPEGEWIADIGFSARRDATGGGAAISPEMMQTMVDLRISLHLSEYGEGASQTSDPS